MECRNNSIIQERIKMAGKNQKAAVGTEKEIKKTPKVKKEKAPGG